MWPASCRTPLCGHRAWGRCRLKSGRARGGHRSSSAVTTSIDDLGQAIGSRLAKPRLAHNQVAGRYDRVALLALCARARSGRHRDYNLTDSRPEEMAVDRVAKGRGRTTKYWLSNASANITFRSLVDLTKLRWRIERDYQELKQEVGLGHFEGRGWRGFHHHATLCIAAYGFLVSERETIPPSASRSVALFPQPAVPHGYRPEALPLRPERHIPTPSRLCAGV